MVFLSTPIPWPCTMRTRLAVAMTARAIDRLCQYHTAYRWLSGGATINHDLLAGFRRDNEALLDRQLTQSVTALIALGFYVGFIVLMLVRGAK